MEPPCLWHRGFHLTSVDMKVGVVGGFFLFLLAGCLQKNDALHHLELAFLMNDSTQAVFPISLQPDGILLQNGGEELSLTAINDTTYLVPVFGGSWSLGPDHSVGFWTDSLRPSGYRVGFQIQPRTIRTQRGEIPQGTWNVWFGETGAEEPADAQLDLKVEADELVGTFRTRTGDYRFFSGTYANGSLQMQTYDGAHLYRIEAAFSDNQWVNGSFYSGNHYHTFWSALPAVVWSSDHAVGFEQVTDEDLFITTLDQLGEDTLLSLLPAANEVVVVDILGTWCPNCMDEVRLLKELKNKHPDIRIVSIAYERDTIPEDVTRRLEFYKTQLGIDWELHWGGPSRKTAAASTFRFLDEVISFPTTLFIHPDGTVAIHSGFNGPATGERYKEEQLMFERLVATPLTTAP